MSGTPRSNTLRYRVRFPEEAVRSRGFKTAAVHYTDPRALDWIRGADLLALYRVPARSNVLEAVRRAREQQIPVTYDIDDLVFAKRHVDGIAFVQDLPEKQRNRFLRDALDRPAAMRLSDRVSGSTTVIASELERVASCPVEVLPNGLSIDGVALAAATRPRASDGRVRLAYFSGSATHEKDWEVIEPVVLETLARHPSVDLWMVGAVKGGPDLSRFESRVRRMSLVDWRDLPSLIAQVDINLAPLEDVFFTAGKSALKWLEAAVVQVPTIASPTPPFQEVIRPGETGMLAHDNASWAAALEALVIDEPLRLAMGQAARVQALDEFGPERQADRYQGFFERALSSPRSGSGAGPGPQLTELEAFDFRPGLREQTFEAPHNVPGRKAKQPVAAHSYRVRLTESWRGAGLGSRSFARSLGLGESRRHPASGQRV